MATIDWPTDSVFKPAAVTFGSATSKSGFQGFYSGDRHSVSHLSDRHTMQLILPPCVGLAAAGRRSALLQALDSTGDFVRMPAFHRRYPLGTISGTVTTSGSAIAAASSLALTGCRAGRNLLLASEAFTAAAWVNAWGGAIVRIANAGVAPDGNTTAEYLNSGGGGSAVAQSVAVTTGVVYTFSVYAQVRNAGGTLATAANLQIRDGSGGAAVVLAGDSSAITTAWTRVSITWTSDRTAAVFPGVVIPDATTDGIFVWGAQLEASATATTYSGLPTLLAGDLIGVGGNLLLVGYAGATANDAGAMTVPLALPLQEDVAGGSAVTYSAPTGLWMLDTDGIALDFSPASVQQGIALQVRQVIA